MEAKVEEEEVLEEEGEVAVEKAQVKFGMMKMIFVSSVTQEFHPGLAAVLAREEHNQNGGLKPEGPYRHSI